MPIQLESLVVRNDRPMSVRVDDDLVILNMAGDNYIALDAIGRRIWELLAAPLRVDELCRQLSVEFNSSQEEILEDVLPFLNELEGEGLVLRELDNHV
jgi:hypothetical protein